MKHQPVLVAKAPATEGDFLSAFEGLGSKRICEGAVDALQSLEEKPAHVLVIDDALEDMAAVELAEVIRDIDTEKNHHTFIVVVGNEMPKAMGEAFTSDIDAFVQRNDLAMMQAVLLAGLRISATLNDLAENNAGLLRERDILRQGQLLDPLTGLGNQKLARQSLEDVIRQIESRGGAACFLMMKVGNFEKTLEGHDETISNALIVAIAERLQALVRPMDIVSYWDAGVFALVFLQPSITQCSAECYQRIFDGIRLKSYRTAAGYLDATIGMSIAASHAENGPPNPETLIARAAANLPEAVKTQQIMVEHLSDG